MNKKPFFSVLIPTKNRSHIIKYAIESVLSQDFEDFEIIIMDNDDSNNTYESVNKFNDHRIKYFKSGNLNMAENWEAALHQANGLYVTVLEDKHVYYSYALKSIYNYINDFKKDIIVWDWDHYDENNHNGYHYNRSRKAYEMTSDQILNDYVSLISEGCKNLPRMINACASNEVIQKAINKSNDRSFFTELSPDLNAAFSLLAVGESVLIVEISLGLGGYSNLSNAKKIRTKGYDYYGNLRNKKMHYTPIKSMILTYNTVYNDFLRLKDSFSNSNLDKHTMTNLTYCCVCLWDAIRIYSSTKSFRSLFNELPPIFSYIRKSNFGLSKYKIPFLLFKVIFKSVVNRVNVRYKSKEYYAKDIYLATKNRPSSSLK
jgi:glycosyltransferase involved in cell wall biosynthesis